MNDPPLAPQSPRQGVVYNHAGSREPGLSGLRESSPSGVEGHLCGSG